MKRTKSKLDLEIPGTVWVLRLEENAWGQAGYFSHSDEKRLYVRRELNGQVQTYPTERAALQASRWLQKQFKLSREHITPEHKAHGTTASFWFGRGRFPDGMSLEFSEKTGERYFLVRQGGEEFTTGDLDLADNVADAIVRLFDTLHQRLRKRRRT